MIVDFIVSVLISILLVVAISILGSYHIRQIIKHGKPTIYDYKHLANDTIKAKNPTEWEKFSNYNSYVISDTIRQKIEEYQTSAFLVFQNGKIKYEEYWQGHQKDSLSNSFSIAKSVVSILIGIAIDEKYIESVNQKVTDFLPEFNGDKPTELTIKDLLTMSSGIKWSENFDSPFFDVAKAYYGNNLQKQIKKLKIADEIGKNFNYKCVNTQLLVQILEVATKTDIASYAQRNLWYPIGAEHDALWSKDHENGTVKGFCCLNATARDFARLGHLILWEGEFNQNFVVPREYLKNAIQPADYLTNSKGEAVTYYGWHFWIVEHNGEKIPMLNGIKGQYIFVLKKRNAVVVRLGHKQSPEKINGQQTDIPMYLDLANKILD